MDEMIKREIEQQYREMRDQLLVYAYSVLRNWDLAEEAVQDAFRIACSKPDDFLGNENPRGWLFNTLKFSLREMQRNRTKMGDLIIKIIQSNGPNGQLDEIDVDVLYSDLTEQEAYRLIKKIALEQKTMLEVADELGITLSACKKRVQRARELLQKKFEKYQK